jgi:acyl-CoA synthetase
VTGAQVLQFYGSNETGLLSGTFYGESIQRRLDTAGQVVPEMNVRLFDGDNDVTTTGRGQPACRGPATGIGYLDDVDGNAQLFTSDGWMLMADICTLDPEGYLSVVGRASDIIIRGGKNISAAQVESEVAAHPDVVLAAAVPVEDPVFGEKVCVYVELRPGTSLELPNLSAFLSERGTSKEIIPEYLIVLDHLPISVGGKVAKASLRDDARHRAGHQ